MAESAELPEPPYLYDAFISYRHVERDRKWAEWLIEALEGYRVPNALQERGFPRRLRKVFASRRNRSTGSRRALARHSRP